MTAEVAYLEADQIDLLRWALEDYVDCAGEHAAAKLKIDYGSDIAEMDATTLVKACAGSLWQLCNEKSNVL